MIYDATGRLLFTDASAPGIYAVACGGTPALLTADIPINANGIAVAPDGRIFTRSTGDDAIRIYDSNGVLSNPNFAPGVGCPTPAAMAFGPGGAWGTDLYTVSNGDLLRIDATTGSSAVIGTGFGVLYPGCNTPSDMVFGPDGALYVSMFDEDRVLRIAVKDCNGNGIPDDQDIAADPSIDHDGNGIPDSCDIPADVNGDGCVNLSDLAEVLAFFGRCVYQ